MRTVKIYKDELLTKLKSNRDDHRAGFLKALDAYRREAIEVLEEAIEDAKAGKRIITSTHLIEPVDMTREYDQVIAMLQMSVDDIVELTHQEFQNYVMDNWSWSEHVSASNTAYLAKWS